MNRQKRKAPLRQAWARLRAFVKTSAALSLLVCVAGSAVLVALFIAAVAPVQYDLRVGMVPQNTITANKDVIDEVTTEKKRAEAAKAVAASYYYQEGVTERVLATFDEIFTQLRAVRQYAETLAEPGTAHAYTTEELAYARGILTMVPLRDYQLRTALNTAPEALETLYASLYSAVYNKMADNVTQGKETDAITSIMQIVGYRTDTSLLQNVVQPLLKVCIEANMVIDQEATETARDAARELVEPVVYKQGQNIVVKGQGLVEEYQLAMLRSLGLLSDGETDINVFEGAALFVALVMVVLLLALKRVNAEVMRDSKRQMLFFCVLITVLGVSILCRIQSVYLAPVTLTAMLLTAMLGMQTGVFAGVAMTLVVGALAAGGTETYTSEMVHVIVAGTVSCVAAGLLMDGKSTRVRALLTGLVAAALNLIAIFSMGLMTDNNLQGVLEDALWCMGGGILSALLCVAFQPLLEIAFNLPTAAKLLDLSNPNQPLLRRLMLEAPGTYHHSIIVANLAEGAAEAVGASPLLARVGGYYHDIGKLKRPLYFKENQLGEQNAHDHTDPQVSAAILIAHVVDGVQLARDYRLPAEVQRIIATHHGDTPVMYFYHKALQQAGGNPVDIAAFRYDGPPPDTREAAIVMLADTIEAAVRSMQNPTPERIEDFIVKLVRGKLEDGQLANCPLTLRDIDLVCTAFTTVLVGVFHERIEYPDAQTPPREQPKEPEVPAEAHGKEETQSEPAPAPEAPAAEEAPQEPSAPPAPEPRPALMPVITPELVAPKAPVPVVEPSQFEGDEPLPVVTPPPVLEPVTIEAAMPNVEEAPEDGGEKTDA